MSANRSSPWGPYQPDDSEKNYQKYVKKAVLLVNYALIHASLSVMIPCHLAGIKLVKADDFETWWFTIEVMGESLYKGEIFTLQFRFDAQYPISAPAVQFVVTDGKLPPVHPHVYSNGHICASILGNEWSPVLSVVAVCVTLQSMLASCKKKERPVDNDRYVRYAPENPKKTRFHYDDDTV